MEHCIFKDPKTNRIYKVSIIAFDRTKGVIAYRRSLDDLPPDENDDKPWKVEGVNGIAEAVAKYHAEHGDSRYPTTTEQTIKWPSSEQEMLLIQQGDPNLSQIMEQLNEAIDKGEEELHVTETKCYYFHNTTEGRGALRVTDSRNEDKKVNSKIVLPTGLRNQLIGFYHDEAGHPGRDRTILTIQQMYWWKGLREDVETYIASCNYCQLQKPNNHATKAPLQQSPTPTFPFEIVHIDLTGDKLPKTRRGNKLILVLKCSLTRYVEIVPIKDKSELTVARVMVERIYCRHGAPKVVISDRGSEFINKTMKQVCVLLNIGRITTTAYHPQANGLVEQHNGTVKNMLAAYCNRYQDDWDIYLPHVAYAYNTTISSATGYTPFCMLYGREARQLCNEWIEEYMTTVKTPVKYVYDLANALQLGWMLAGLKRTPTVEGWNKINRTRQKFKEYEIGAQFYLRNTPTHMATTTSLEELPKDLRTDDKHIITSGLQARWTGPYTITKKFSPVLYECVIMGKPMIVHHLHMKPSVMHRILNKEDMKRMANKLPMKERKRALTTITKMDAILDRDHSAKTPVEASKTRNPDFEDEDEEDGHEEQEEDNEEEKEEAEEEE